MPSKTGRPQSRFRRLYDALSPDTQQHLVRRHLAPLLDTVPRDRQRAVLASAARLHRRHARMPALNLPAKKAEVNALLLELSRDSKRSLIRERSRREQLLSEAVDSLARWLSDIWMVVFEFRTNFALAHSCLLFACDALDQIANSCGGCRCAYASMYVPVRIRRSTGELVRSFPLDGAHKLESILLWIWRDLFVALLATGSKRQRSAIPDMITDIRALLGWRAMELLLAGGAHSDLADGEQEEDEDLVEREPDETRQRLDIIDDDGDQNYVSDNCSTACDEQLYPSTFYAAHWSWRISDQQPRLRALVHAALLNVFKVAPSGPLYSSMIAITEDADELEQELHPLLMSAAGHSPENLAAALRILSMNNRTHSVDKLLQEHKHLLRPQDAPSLQFAVLIMSSNYFCLSHAISIIEEELLDVSYVFRGAIRFSFCNIDSEVNKTELAQILALPLDSLSRRSRVQRWVKGIVTPQAERSHPMALAALMIGIPLPPGTEGGDGGDMLGYFEVDGDDPELEDLREEFRPNIKARLQGWVDTAGAIKGGAAVMMEVYGKVIREMPFLNGKDVVEEMSARMADRPSRAHVADALEAFMEFCEKQSAKLRHAKTRAARAGRASVSEPGPTSPTS